MLFRKGPKTGLRLASINFESVQLDGNCGGLVAERLAVIDSGIVDALKKLETRSRFMITYPRSDTGIASILG